MTSPGCAPSVFGASYADPGASPEDDASLLDPLGDDEPQPVAPPADPALARSSPTTNRIRERAPARAIIVKVLSGRLAARGARDRDAQ
jgi:hypothetical protein